MPTPRRTPTRPGLVVAALLALALTAAAGCAPRADKLDSPLTGKIEQGIAEGKGSFDHSAFDALLQKHVRFEQGRVDYEGLKADRAALDDYLKRVAAVDPATLGRDELMALLINAYNGYTLVLILDHYPGVKSIRDLDKPWDTAAYAVGGSTISLNNIEHGLLRPVFKDPRIHFAVNCASIGCPPLLDRAFTGPTLDAQLEAQTRHVANNPRYTQVKDGKLVVSKLLDWYGADFKNESFIKTAPSLPRFLAPYAEGETAALLKKNPDPPVDFLDYDWNLNAAAP